ncbi:uncharacterized protein LOC144166199 [Haemaphysalis longicornis]
MGARKQTTSCYSPQANVTERRNRDVKTLLGAYARTHRDWDEHLNASSFGLLTSENRSNGFTPAFPTFGPELPISMDTVFAKRLDNGEAQTAVTDYARRLRERLATAITIANQNREKDRAVQKVTYDRAHRNVEYQTGDTVLRRNYTLSDANTGFAASLAPKCVGRFAVAKKVSQLNYVLREGETGRITRTIHVGELKPYFPREEMASSTEESQKQDPAKAPPVDAAAPHRYNTRRGRRNRPRQLSGTQRLGN